MLSAIGCAIGPAASARGGDAPATSKFRLPEAFEMLATIIASGADMGPGDGWFHPGRSRYGWKWLASRLDSDHDGEVTSAEWGDIDKSFLATLDRDRSQAITADDLDWSPNSEYFERLAPARRLWYTLDADSNGRIAPEEWASLYQTLAGEKGFLSADDLAGWVAPPPPPPPSPGEIPSRWTLLKGFLRGELGSPREGPAVDSQAPDFTLRTHDRERTITLGQFRGEKPVVLVFGSFT
jgi:hypothetical protein